MEREWRHFFEVILSFQEYGSFTIREVERRSRHLEKLPARHQTHVSALYKGDSRKILVDAVEANNKFYNLMLQMQNGFSPPGDRSAFDFGEEYQFEPTALRSTEGNLSKVTSTLHQCVRDWSTEGKAERDSCYTPIIDEIQRVLPLSDAAKMPIKVLVPGSGLGRLPLEIAAKGYAAQGNEFSYHMLLVSNFLLNCGVEKESLEIYPWIDQPSNCKSFVDLARSTSIPDFDFQNIPEDCPLDMSYVAGDFVEIYKKQEQQWNCIVTCFFIDTAANFIEFIEVIFNCLKEGGTWINFGPLLFHWQKGSGSNDERYEQSVELPYDEVKNIAQSIGFVFQREEWKETTYNANFRSMMRNVYDCAFFTAIKPVGK